MERVGSDCCDKELSNAFQYFGTTDYEWIKVFIEGYILCCLSQRYIRRNLFNSVALSRGVGLVAGDIVAIYKYTIDRDYVPHFEMHDVTNHDIIYTDHNLHPSSNDFDITIFFLRL